MKTGIMYEKFILILLVIIVGIILIGGFLVYQYWWAPKLEEESEKTVPQDKIVEWKTYKNEEYGYEIEYPSNWELFTSPPILEWDVFIDGQIIIVRWVKKGVARSWIRVIPRENKLNLEPERALNDLYQLSRYVSALEGLKLDSEEDIIFNGCLTKKLIYISEDPEISYTKITYLIQESDKMIYDLTLKTYELSEINDIFNQMISSFKFID